MKSTPFADSVFTPDADAYIVSEGTDWDELVAEYMNGYIAQVMKDEPPDFDLYTHPELVMTVSLPGFDYDASWSAPLRAILEDALETNDWSEPETDLEAMAVEFDKLAKLVRAFKEEYRE